MLYGFVALVDPWDALPLSPPLPRVPISTNARYSFPALARSPRFDSIILGDSTARLLQPAILDEGFGAHFANLAMNAATAWEEQALLGVFLRVHPAPRVVIVAIAQIGCSDSKLRWRAGAFPEWLYGPNRWAGYREMLTPYAVQEAANQFAVMLGWKRRRYGLDGYTRFVPPDADYDPARRDQLFRTLAPVNTEPAPAEAAPELPQLRVLDEMLATVPAGTRVILFLPPVSVEVQGSPGTKLAWRWAGCKREVAAIARRHGALALDFAIDSALTRSRDNYWDPVHYREAIARRVMAGLIAGSSPEATTLGISRTKGLGSSAHPH